MKCSTKRTTISCLTTSWMIMAALLFLSHLLVIGVQAQDAGADDGGGDTGGDGSDLTQGDPNIVNTPNKQGYGKDVSTNVRKTTAMKITPQDKTIAEQSIQALFQLGVLVGVALMVGILFMLNIGLDLCMEAMTEKAMEVFCKKKISNDPEDPAALVGTFKRYK